MSLIHFGVAPHTSVTGRYPEIVSKANRTDLESYENASMDLFGVAHEPIRLWSNERKHMYELQVLAGRLTIGDQIACGTIVQKSKSLSVSLNGGRNRSDCFAAS